MPSDATPRPDSRMTDSRATADRQDIGTHGGLCNRTACRAPGARWWNSSTRKYYCVECACRINQEARRFNEEPLCDYRENA